ncbi:zinc finger Y-chromosomal protein 2-like [Frieseomelitta varia]|nr:zinc finger Y-chromosomal protein 2-like [Frieseomelitta varia]
MSRKGIPSACKSKQIPRIFRNRRGLCSIRSWPQCEAGIASSPIGYNQLSLLSGSPDEDKREETSKKGKQEEEARDDEAIRYRDKVWIEDNQATSGSVAGESNVDIVEIGKAADVETVADIEKWLKTRSESVSSMDLDAIKSGVEEGVDRYLGEELQHAFLEKDPDGLSIDIDLSDKKLNLGYDPLLQELQSEKLLDEKDSFILPEFQLDHLDPLALSPDDMMVAGEILPSTSAQPALSVPNSICTETVQTSLMKKAITPDSQELQNKSTQVVVDDLRCVDNTTKEIDLQKDSGLCDATNLYTQDVNSENTVDELSDAKLDEDDSDSAVVEQLKTKSKVKLEPRIIKKRKKMPDTMEKKFNNEIRISGDDIVDTENGVMAVVAISTDKISNMTQIVINTGTEEQIYQGKTSELIEATGNFPKLPKIETSTVWNGTVEHTAENPSNQHEMIISNALEELGITDDNLQPISVNEHGKIWLCPRDDCNRQFSKLYALKGHLLAHYGVRPFKCDFEGCAWAFYSEFKLKRHKETHLKRKDYVCEVEGCNRRFTTIYNLWSHAKLHTRPNRIVCQVPDCQEKFQTKRALELHMKTHDQSHAPYVCKHEGCGKRYYSSNALTSHQRCHSYKEVDVKCSWPGCGKVFDKPCRLKAHIRSHTGCKPYPCTFQGCQWAFSSSSKLKRHQKKHTNERKFVCDIPSCGKAFMRSEHLKEHRLTHKEGRYFQCFICNAKFSAKSSLYVHIKKHQVKEEVEINSHDDVNSRSKKIPLIIKSKRKSIDLNVNVSCLNTSTKKSDRDDTIIENNDENQTKNDIVPPRDPSKTLYHCPVETCTRSYTTKATLRAHMLKVHGTPVEECNKAANKTPEDSVCNMDYILYTTPSVSEPTEQMIMVAPCDAVILSTPSGTDRSLPEPEPPPLNNLIKTSESSSNTATHKQLFNQHVRKDQGSARTDLTFSDVWKLKKTNGAVLDSVVGASDVVLGTSELEEGLLLTEELPSMYYQDDVVGTEYQVLLLDSVSSENTINLRGLE